MHAYNLALCMYVYFFSFLCCLNKLNRNLHTKKEMWWDWSFHFAKRILHCHEKVQIYAVFALGISTSFFLLEFPIFLKSKKSSEWFKVWFLKIWTLLDLGKFDLFSVRLSGVVWISFEFNYGEKSRFEGLQISTFQV